MLKRRELHGMVALALFGAFTPAPAQQVAEQSLTVEQCVALALQDNPQILSSQDAIAESEARIHEARAGYFPTLSLSTNASRYSGVFEKGGGAASTAESYDTGLSARYYLFQGWRTVAASEAAQSNYQATSFQHESNRQDVVLRVKQAYYRLLQAQRLVQVAEKSAQRAQLHLDFANARFTSGVASRSDILKAEVELSNASLALIRAKNGGLSAQGALNVLLGRMANSSIAILDDLSMPAREKISEFETLLYTALRSHPDLKKMQSQLNVQRSYVRLARSDFFPSLSVDGNYNWSGTSISQLDKSWFVGLTMSLPLFTGFSTSAKVAQEETALQGLQKQQEALRQQISLEVWNAHLGVKEAGERIDNTKKFLENAQENLNIAEGEYREGVGSMIDVTDAQTALITAEQSYIEALTDFKIALATLNGALGVNDIQEE